MIDLTGRTAIVTGSSRGLGEATAVRMAEAGANVVGAARSEEDLAETMAEAESHGAETLGVTVDMTDFDDIDRLFEETVETFGSPHILVNNAGTFYASPPLEQPFDEIDHMIDLNMRGLMYASQVFGREFQASDHEEGGRIINLASNVATVSVPLWMGYSATKGAVLAITRTLALELVRDGVTVNSVTPGTIRTPGVERDIEERGDELYDWDGNPMGELGEPEDIANACLYLASDLASYVNGAELVVDGGVTVTSSWYSGTPWRGRD
jgi:NAD(P)-dependent dehydrogenase (short-subunit alcohol dehydrogenase family)